MSLNDHLAWEITRDVTKFAVPPIILLLLGVWTYTAYFAPKLYDGVKLQNGVVYASARRYAENGIEAIEQDGDDVKFQEWQSLVAAGQISTDVTILVHGYNTQDNKVAACFSGLIDHLQQTAHYQGTIIVFDWPTQGVPHDELPAVLRLQRDLYMEGHNRNAQPAYEYTMYRMDQKSAEGIGVTSFLSLLGSLAVEPARRITLIGHSMGCHLLQHALSQSPEAFQRVSALYWLAPDVDVDVLTNQAFLRSLEALSTGLFVHYSKNDNILTGLSHVANGQPRIGAVGPGPHTVTVATIQFTDMTSALGAENVHSGYLLAGSESVRQIAAHLVRR